MPRRRVFCNLHRASARIHIQTFDMAHISEHHKCPKHLKKQYRACVSPMFVKIISFSLFQHRSLPLLPHSRSRQSISQPLSALAWQIYSRRMETSGSYLVKSSLSVPICPAGTLIKLSVRRPQSQLLETLHQCCFFTLQFHYSV